MDTPEAKTCSLNDGKVQDGVVGRQTDNMPVKVLIQEKNELRLRITGESHTALQILRDRLNNHKSVEYANYFPGHPDLDPPEFYIRTTGKAKPDAVLNEIVKSLSSEFDSLTL
ncbi:MAG: RpoL/Rpb11 RNA polymerase subunit family protein [Candidatus Poseidoniaceae archaeon]